MAIAPSGTFEYRITVRKDESMAGAWIGRAEPSRDPSRHPGMAGERPHMSLKGGLLSLHASESAASLSANQHYQRWGKPIDVVTVAVGAAIEAVVQDADELRVSRGGTGDLAMTLSRASSLVLALGSIAHMTLGADVKMEEDLRAAEQNLYYLRNWFARPNTQLIWIDPADDIAAGLSMIAEAPAGVSLLIAVRMAEGADAYTLNQQVFEIRSKAASLTYERVDPRFATANDWLEYLIGLPTSRPTDLHIAVTIGDKHKAICEGEYAFLKPFHAFVARVFTPGIPGKWSHLGLAREHPRLTREMFIESVNQIASSQITFDRPRS